MIWSDVYALLALAADRTSTINIGTGVAVAGTRIAPGTAAAIGTINELAPGRTWLVYTSPSPRDRTRPRMPASA
mgnify:CR=1 FL=1